ncbi:MAG: hypothetical protein AAF557_11435 [Pseudomonadota bacterium]
MILPAYPIKQFLLAALLVFLPIESGHALLFGNNAAARHACPTKFGDFVAVEQSWENLIRGKFQKLDGWALTLSTYHDSQESVSGYRLMLSVSTKNEPEISRHAIIVVDNCNEVMLLVSPPQKDPDWLYRIVKVSA